MEVWRLRSESTVGVEAIRHLKAPDVPLPDGDEVTYAYPRASFAEPAE